MVKWKKQTLSIVIATRNEEKKIKGAIESVLWADEIIVIDHFSTDKTGMINANDFFCP